MNFDVFSDSAVLAPFDWEEPEAEEAPKTRSRAKAQDNPDTSGATARVSRSAAQPSARGRSMDRGSRQSFMDGLKVPELYSDMREELMQGFLSATNYQAKEMRKLDRSISKSRSRSSLRTAPVESEMGDYDEGEASGSGSGSGSGSFEDEEGGEGEEGEEGHEGEEGIEEEEEEEEEPVVPTRKGKERERGWRKGE